MDNLQIDTYLVGPIVHSCHRTRRCRPFPWSCATCSLVAMVLICVVQHLLTANGTGDGVAMLPRGALHRRTCKGARRGGQEFRPDSAAQEL
jgi:hypothetical protein